jgi:hypothetical protein
MEHGGLLSGRGARAPTKLRQRCRVLEPSRSARRRPDAMPAQRGMQMIFCLHCGPRRAAGKRGQRGEEAGLRRLLADGFPSVAGRRRVNRAPAAPAAAPPWPGGRPAPTGGARSPATCCPPVLPCTIRVTRCTPRQIKARGLLAPGEAGERIGLAKLCQEYKKLYGTTARFYAVAFAAEPKKQGKGSGRGGLAEERSGRRSPT